ncbi:MAG: amylo-alpha-1,6-glucosidase [Victivallaceae bacterium]|nr:amylo-alpha-1,6-glucosidase [Victivallaceae bacterium]
MTFRVEGFDPVWGRPVVRTNIGRAAVRRDELIARTREDKAISGLDWHDIELAACGGGAAEITLALVEPGDFEAKCCVVPFGAGQVLWADGDNIHLKVEPASTVGGNSMYSAFVRQFRPGMEATSSAAPACDLDRLDRDGYTVIPPSGTFRKLAAKLDHIMGDLGCRIVQLLPVHPTPTSFGRMGRYGSPFAATDYFAVDPALADFDPTATPMEQFKELVDAVHAHNGRIFMDIPVNHTGWASKLQSEHPDYFVRSADGKFESPGAWGVVWADLCKLNYRDGRVHELMAQVFRFWCRRGVDGFRCDAGYMLPAEAWSYITAAVRTEYPDTVFLLEGLGGLISVQEELLTRRGLDWGYSELFQNYTRDQITAYLPYAVGCSCRCGTLVNFAETHDNNRLAATSRVYAKLRFAVAALTAGNGAFGFANGAEFFATEKIDVHGCGALNWGASPNLVDFAARLNRVLATHPAFGRGSRIEPVQNGPGNVLAVRRTPAADEAAGRIVLALFNLDCDNAGEICWPTFITPDRGFDLLSGGSASFERDGENYKLRIEPGGSRCFVFDDWRLPEEKRFAEAATVLRQRADAMARRSAVKFCGVAAAGALKRPGAEFLAAPEKFIEKISGAAPAPLAHWRTGRDERREVMLAPGDVLLIESRSRFHAELRLDDRAIDAATSLADDGGRHVALLLPPENEGGRERRLRLTVAIYDRDGSTRRTRGEIVQLAAGGRRRIALNSSSRQVQDGHLHVFTANNRGGYAFFPAAWGTISSKYHAILAANASADYPTDRYNMFTRCRSWITVKGYSQEIELDSLVSFHSGGDNRARWEYLSPAGQGCRVPLEIDFAGALDANQIRIRFHRRLSEGAPGLLEDASPIRIVLRPDVEDRVNHEVTKAFRGEEGRFRSAVQAYGDGFDFAPDVRKLSLRVPGGRFVREDEWHYMVDLPDERYYGMEDKTDLFSPGYFEFILKGGETCTLEASVSLPGFDPAQVSWPVDGDYPADVAPHDLFNESMRRYVVKRDEFSTVIAGYPWFLDWGRDTLIVLRGLVTGGFRAETAAVIRQFASFERNGTIPNMIRGKDDRNRDTSDAPLYLAVAARDYVRAARSEKLLDADCGGRSLRQVITSILDNYWSGTPNGIAADQESGLVFSPSHFTWMDTNFPAGTPREGYPVEIQALWYAALEFASGWEPRFGKIAKLVRDTISRRFFGSGNGCAADCLHASRGVPAAQAVADDHIRPNQLLLITLGAVTDRAGQLAILNGCEELLAPGCIRTLADRPVDYMLPIDLNGRRLNDPAHPYWGHYRGPEDTSRKPAYHNGTAWCWPFPAYCEALLMTGGAPQRERALALLLSMAHFFESGVPGHAPEVADGDAPHTAGGCLAQAWSVSEFFRVLALLKK